MILFLGDLNYRVNGTKESIMQAMQDNMFDALQQNDQLNI